MINYNSEDLEDHHGISAIIKDDKGNILMQKHVKYGFWTIPVGKAKSTQTPLEALKEEIKEECNIDIIKQKEIIYKEYEYLRNGIKVKVFSHLFEVLSYVGEIKNNEPEKHYEQCFLSIEEILKKPYLSDTTILYLDSIGIKREKRI
jgi:8-oxo-dGTP pyrophosphatase MutT (NUDIX family)